MAEHLSDEILARMVDGPAEPDERRHVDSCPACASDLRALHEQTAALGSLPLLRPPRGDWSTLEQRLRSEGLLRARGAAAGAGGPDRTGAGWGIERGSVRGWLRIAAALVLFVGGGVAGAALSGGGAGFLPGTGAGFGVGETRFASAGAEGPSAGSVDEAAEEVRLAERRYVEALLRYRELTGTGAAEGPYDPADRYAALDAILAVSRAAVQDAPTDPFLNGVLVSTLAERQATLQRISTASGEWY